LKFLNLQTILLQQLKGELNMKKNIFALATVILATSLSNACPGGNLLQIVDKASGVAVASYDIASGDMVSRSKSHRIVKVVDAQNKKTSLCVDAACEELKDMTNTDILVTYAQTMSSQRMTVTIRNVSIGADTPIAKGIKPRGMPQPDAEIVREISDKTQVFSCSNKN
jgi:hypothetical protein